MPCMSADSTFLQIETAAHGGAFGNNPIPAPTEAQCLSGNYKVGRASIYGLAIAIEQPRGSYRTGIDSKTGKRWASRMAAHYGYINGTKGNDGDCVDCFIGFYPQSQAAFVINQNVGGKFDEHKVMLAYPDEESARRAYLDSYERGWNGLASIIPLSVSQLKWWLRNGDMRRPLRAENLPHEGLETMTRKVQWNSDALPYDQTLDQVLYEVRRSDAGESLLLDAVSTQDIIEDSDGALAFDALVTPYAKLERKMEVLQGVMVRSGESVKPVAMQVTEPFKQRGVANVAAIFELSDGQTVSIFFHNPDVTPNKMAASDEVISWKWLLNKKDITIVVAPERGEDLNIREVARRIIRLAEKNSPAFQRANGKRAERMQGIQTLKDEITSLESELAAAQHELEVAKVSAEDAQNRKNREYAEAVQRVNETGDAYIRAGENGGIDPKTGKTKEELRALSDSQAADAQRLKDIANGVQPKQEEGGAPTPNNAGTLSRSVPEAGMQERPKVRADESGSPVEPARSEGGAGSNGDATDIPAAVQASALEAARKEQDRLNEYDLKEEIRSLSENGGVDLSPLTGNPEYWDAENEEFTEAGFKEVDRLTAEKAMNNLRLQALNDLSDLDDAHQFAQVEAMEKILDGLGVGYQRNYSFSSSRYIMVNQGDDKPDFKLRFADHLNTARDQPSPDVNVAPGGDKFVDAVKAVLEIANAAKVGAGETAQKPDISYRNSADGLFTSFFPNTPEGEKAWNIINATPGAEGGKVLAAHAESTIAQLRSAGYTVGAEPVSAPTTPEEDAALLAEIGKVAIPAVDVQNEAKTEGAIELTGNELGDFPETEEGKKALRNAAIKFYEDNLMTLDGVVNLALDHLVEFDGRGKGKIKSFSADPRKLHVVAKLENIVRNGKPTPISPMQPHQMAASRKVKLVHVLKTPVLLDGKSIKVRFLVQETADGHFFYDHSIDREELRGALGRSSGVLDSADAADLWPSVLLPDEPSSGQRSLDSVAKSGKVFNLFFEGEEPEEIADEPEEEGKESARIESILAAADGAAKVRYEAGGKVYISAAGDGKQGEMRYVLFYYKGSAGEFLKSYRHGNGLLSDAFLANVQKVEKAFAEAGIAVVDKEGNITMAPSQPEAKAATQEAKSEATEGPAKDRMAALKMLTDTGMNVWMSEGQNKAVIAGLMGEEWKFFADKMKELSSVIGGMPKTYDQDGMGDAAVAHLHYFRGAADWYITEKDMEGKGTEQAFGLADLGYGGELGYISIDELISAGVELDFHFAPKTVGQIKGKSEAGAPESQEKAPEVSPEDQQKQADQALFQSVIDGSIPDILAPELADSLEAAYYRQQTDPALVSLFEQAVSAYQNAMMSATAELA